MLIQLSLKTWGPEVFRIQKLCCYALWIGSRMVLTDVVFYTVVLIGVFKFIFWSIITTYIAIHGTAFVSVRRVVCLMSDIFDECLINKNFAGVSPKCHSHALWKKRTTPHPTPQKSITWEGSNQPTNNQSDTSQDNEYLSRPTRRVLEGEGTRGTVFSRWRDEGHDGHFKARQQKPSSS
jgi:hypothetical protein